MHIRVHQSERVNAAVAVRTLRTIAESSRAAPMLEGGEDPQPNSDIHSSFPVGLTSFRSCARFVPRYCIGHKSLKVRFCGRKS